MNKAQLIEAYNDWKSQSPDPDTDAGFIAWLEGGEETQVVTDTLINERTIAFAVTQATGNPALAEAAIQGIEAASEGNAVIARALRWMRPSDGGIDAGNAATRGMLDQLAAGGAITEIARDAIKALGERTTNRRQRYGLPVVGVPHIERLRLDGRIV